MIKQILKRVIVGLIVSFCFWFIDSYVVHAQSENIDLSISSYNTFEDLYVNNDKIKTQSFYSNYSRLNDHPFSSISTSNKYYGQASFGYRLNSSLPSEKLRKYNSFTFMIGTRNGIYSSARFNTISGGVSSPYFDCEALSLPGRDHFDTAQFSSFKCTYDPSLLKGETTNIGLRVFATPYYLLTYIDSSLSYNVYNNYIPIAYTSAYFTFYASDDNSIVDSIKEQTEAINKQTEATKEQTDTIKDNDTSGAQDSANSFFGDFDNNDYGLSDVITSPLNVIRSITNGTCTPLKFPAPFVDQEIELPCMSSIYKTHFGSFLTIYQTITFGLIAYWVCVNIFRMVKNFKNPDNDEVEVLDL